MPSHAAGAAVAVLPTYRWVEMTLIPRDATCQGAGLTRGVRIPGFPARMHRCCWVRRVAEPGWCQTPFKRCLTPMLRYHSGRTVCHGENWDPVFTAARRSFIFAIPVHIADPDPRPIEGSPFISRGPLFCLQSTPHVDSCTAKFSQRGIVATILERSSQRVVLCERQCSSNEDTDHGYQSKGPAGRSHTR